MLVSKPRVPGEHGLHELLDVETSSDGCRSLQSTSFVAAVRDSWYRFDMCADKLRCSILLLRAESKASLSSKSDVAPSSPSPLLAYLTPASIATLVFASIGLFVAIFVGELALTQLLKLLFEYVFGGRIRSLDHAVGQLDDPVLLHSAILIFQLVIVSITAFIIGTAAAGGMLSSLLHKKSADVADALLNSGSTLPTLLLLASIALVRGACHVLKFSPSSSLLLLSWSFPFPPLVYDSLFYSLVALSIYAAVSASVSMRRIELLEARTKAEQEKAKAEYLEKKAIWDAQQQRNAATLQQAQQIVAASKNNSPSRQQATVAAGAEPILTPASPMSSSKASGKKQ